MTKFVVYNVQLLPTSEEYADVGGAGYKRLLAELRDLNQKHRRERTLQSFHQSLTGDAFFGPHEFYVRAGFVYGNFIKYTRTNVVSDINRGKVVFQNKTRAMTVSKETLIPFLFDTKTHYLAIDGGAGIKLSILTDVLEKLLSTAKGEHFPNHELHINIVASADDVDHILASATAFKKIEVDLTFQNGGGKTQEFLKEMRASRTQRLQVAASGGSGKIARMPSFLDEMVRAAALVGSLQLTYYLDGSARKHTYDSKESPLAFVCRRSSNDDDTRYFDRVRGQLAKLTEKAEVAADAVHAADDVSGDATDANDGSLDDNI